jgi:hypothetical protein
LAKFSGDEINSVRGSVVARTRFHDCAIRGIERASPY